METKEEEYIYELIDIEWDFDFSRLEDPQPRIVADDTEYEYHSAKPIEYDANQIPLGNSKQEMKMREKIIKDFYGQWIASNPQKMIWNENLSANIHVKFKSINETVSKAARTYESTIAVFSLTEILKTAVVIKDDSTKNNMNQKGFERMLIMRAQEKIKLMVGFQTATQEYVQYSITVPGQQKSPSNIDEL